MTPTPDKPAGETKWWDTAIREHAAEHGPGGDAWNISMILERLRRTPPPSALDDEVARVIAGLRSASFHLEVMDRGPELPHIVEIQKAIALLTRIKDSK